MSTQKIPQLSLFNSRKNNHHGGYSREKFYQFDQVKVNSNRREFERKLNGYSNYGKGSGQPTRDYGSGYGGGNYGRPGSQSLYKNIAERCLDNRVRIPVIYPEAIAYGPPIGTYGYSNLGASNRKIHGPCQCEYEKENESDRDVLLRKNPYIQNAKQRKVPQQLQPKIQKQPYLIPTFRDNAAYQQKNKPTKNTNPNKPKQSTVLSFLQKSGYQNTSKIVQKIKTNQSGQQQEHQPSSHPNKNLISQQLQTSFINTNQIQIQTQKYKNNSSIIDMVNQKYAGKRQEKQKQKQKPSTKTTINNRSSSKNNIYKILQQQKKYIDQLQNEYENESLYKVQLQDLMVSKDEYFSKSNDLLHKLDNIAVMNNVSTFGNKSNLFGSLDI